MSISSSGAIVFVGDLVRYNGMLYAVVDIRNWDSRGDAGVVLENGVVLNSSKIHMDDVICEEE